MHQKDYVYVKEGVPKYELSKKITGCSESDALLILIQN